MDNRVFQFLIIFCYFILDAKRKLVDRNFGTWNVLAEALNGKKRGRGRGSPFKGGQFE